ncbi:MAG: hypothetical protein F4Z31_22790, partial [Gemmatimonadetes bacterium]|nr:hypothetical protein [Gemmatimonadota bacterium]
MKWIRGLLVLLWSLWGLVFASVMLLAVVCVLVITAGVAAAQSRPGPPTDVSVTVARSSTFEQDAYRFDVTTTWQPPADDGGSAILEYAIGTWTQDIGSQSCSSTVQGGSGRLPAAGRSWAHVSSTGRTSTNVVTVADTTNVKRCVIVHARNAVGWGREAGEAVFVEYVIGTARSTGTHTFSPTVLDPLSQPFAINGLADTVTEFGTAYTDPFTYTPVADTDFTPVVVTTTTVGTINPEAGCSLVGTTNGARTLQVIRPDGEDREVTCNVMVGGLSTHAVSQQVRVTFQSSITGLESTGTGGTTYTDPFTYAPTTQPGTVTGTGCRLVGTTPGSRSLEAFSGTAGTVTCTVNVGASATVTARITFVGATSVTGLSSTGSGTAGVAYTDPFTYTPAIADTVVTVTGGGCRIIGDTLLGFRTLEVTSTIAQTRNCEVTVRSPYATAPVQRVAVVFAAGTDPPPD